MTNLCLLFNSNKYFKRFVNKIHSLFSLKKRGLLGQRLGSEGFKTIFRNFLICRNNYVIIQLKVVDFVVRPSVCLSKNN